MVHRKILLNNIEKWAHDDKEEIIEYLSKFCATETIKLLRE